MRFACDTGGTFTDLIVEDDRGGLHMYKASTTPTDPVKGVLDALALAAVDMDLSLADLLAQGDMLIHGTTHAINAIITGNTAKTAFLTTAGHPDILVLREGGRIEPFNFVAPYPEPGSAGGRLGGSLGRLGAGGRSRGGPRASLWRLVEAGKLERVGPAQHHVSGVRGGGPGGERWGFRRSRGGRRSPVVPAGGVPAYSRLVAALQDPRGLVREPGSGRLVAAELATGQHEPPGELLVDGAQARGYEPAQQLQQPQRRDLLDVEDPLENLS